jgi:hypothetical protein
LIEFPPGTLPGFETIEQSADHGADTLRYMD